MQYTWENFKNATWSRVAFWPFSCLLQLEKLKIAKLSHVFAWNMLWIYYTYTHAKYQNGISPWFHQTHQATIHFFRWEVRDRFSAKHRFIVLSFYYLADNWLHAKELQVVQHLSSIIPLYANPHKIYIKNICFPHSLRY